MKKETILWVLVGLAVIGLGVLGYIVAAQNSQLTRVASSMSKLTDKFDVLSQQSATVAAPTASSSGQSLRTASTEQPTRAPADEYQTLAQKMAGQIQLAQLCKGEPKEVYLFDDERRPVSYCMGENRLVVIEKAAEPKVLMTQNVTEAAQAPILIKVELVPSSGLVLISYSPEPCTTTGDCGVGTPSNYVTLAYNPKDGQARPINKYPSDGIPIWNAAGTKAIFVPDTCGGAGCQVIPLIGYDVTRDATQSVTTDKAVGTKENSAKDASGQPLPRWGAIQWKSDADFVANLIKIDGSTQEVAGKF